MVGLLAKADPALRRGREEVGHRARHEVSQARCRYFLLLRRGVRARLTGAVHRATAGSRSPFGTAFRPPAEWARWDARPPAAPGRPPGSMPQREPGVGLFMFGSSMILGPAAPVGSLWSSLCPCGRGTRNRSAIGQNSRTRTAALIVERSQRQQEARIDLSRPPRLHSGITERR